MAGRSVQRIALLYGANPDLDIRVDIALEEARANCPDSQMQVAFIKRGDWTVESGKNIFEAIFLVDSTITTVLAGNDGMAIGVIAAADKMLEPEKAYRLHVSGFDNSAPIKPYIASKRVFSTVDQLTLTANNGIWSTVQKVSNQSHHIHGCLSPGAHL